jgi:hypothetical protein
MLEIEQISKQQSLLTAMLMQLRRGEIHAIEYGNSTQPGSWQSFIRIYWMNTQGGLQFCIKHIYSHVEGSGAYYPEEEQTSKYAMNRIIHYHHSSLVSRANFKRAEVPELSFFAVKNKEDLESSYNKGRGLVQFRNSPAFMPDAVTVTLK